MVLEGLNKGKTHTDCFHHKRSGNRTAVQLVIHSMVFTELVVDNVCVAGIFGWMVVRGWKRLDKVSKMGPCPQIIF